MKTKILVVDDLRENIVALCELIASDDIEAFSAESPEGALSLLLDHDFALALLDVQMPSMSGFDLARLIRGIKRSRHLPIIFVTAQQIQASVIFEGYETGAVDVMFKPLDPHIVRSKVRAFVRIDQQSRLLQQQVETMSRLKEEADAANLAKSRFLANMSHEIRTPLGAVLGFSEVLAQDKVSDPERLKYLDSISRNGRLLLQIIDDILDLSQIEAQQLKLEQREFDLGEALRDLHAALSPRAQAKSLELRMPMDHGSTVFVSDPLRIKQILLNLIGNAIKFTERGSVTVDLKIENVDSLNQRLRFIVKDTGIGLTHDQARKLFAPFTQADDSTRRIFGGTGLGLVIARQLAQALGGNVVLQSAEYGKGATFEASVVVAKATGAAQGKPLKSATPSSRALLASPPVTTLEGHRILIVDDVRDNRELMARYLKSTGLHIGLAESGTEALRMADAEDWELILMDIQMPQMDGYQTTQELRQRGFQNPIIALTAHAMRSELDRCLQAGCDETITKPVTRAGLIKKLQQLLQSFADEKRHLPHPTRPAFEPVRRSPRRGAEEARGE